jgi:hypothetical protein
MISTHVAPALPSTLPMVTASLFDQRQRANVLRTQSASNHAGFLSGSGLALDAVTPAANSTWNWPKYRYGKSYQNHLEHSLRNLAALHAAISL